MNMNKKIFNFLKVSVLLLCSVSFIMFFSCCDENLINDSEDFIPEYIKTFEYNGHGYIFIKDKNISGIIHDPDCKKCMFNKSADL